MNHKGTKDTKGFYKENKKSFCECLLCSLCLCGSNFTTKKLGNEPQRDKGHKGFSQRKLG
jgi:hypothetical protein